MEKVTCPDCGSDMVLRVGPYVFEGGKYKGQRRRFWGCSRYPDCTAAHGAHPNGRPVGIPATSEVKEWRKKAHAVFDRLWMGPDAWLSRRDAYRAVGDVMGLPPIHIGSANIEECRLVIGITERLMKERL